MIAMLDTSQDLQKCAQEIGCEVEQLLTPLTRFKAQHPERHFAIDNGAFAGFKREAFLSLLQREHPRRNLCRFVCAPDVVGSARRTLEVFQHWRPQLSEWPVALVAQDGQEHLPIPWNEIEAIFIGGSTEWKMSFHAITIIKAANAMGKWVHVGRVNTPGRFEHFERAGADSIDGSGLGKYSHMREAIHRNATEPRLGLEIGKGGAA